MYSLKRRPGIARLKTDHLWSSRFSAFERSIYEFGGSYPPQLSELISNKIEISSILDRVDIKPDHRMLDIGAGGGRWILELADRAASVTALEPSDLYELLKNRNSHCKKVTCLKQAFEDFTLRERFDLVICSGVLVCLKDQELAQNFHIKAVVDLKREVISFYESLFPGERNICSTGFPLIICPILRKSSRKASKSKN
jgi:2-polyprenyl-3-methyl-5-hydroxy-6-metoxy-1,4-benzoquinol methylase